jgi:hypothetical protein
MQQEEDSFHYQIGLKFKEETIKVLHLEYILVLCQKILTLKLGQKYLKRFEMWCWRRMEKIS